MTRNILRTKLLCTARPDPCSINGNVLSCTTGFCIDCITLVMVYQVSCNSWFRTSRLSERIHQAGSRKHDWWAPRKRTEAQVRNRGYWPGWTDGVRRFLRKCATCSRYHRRPPPKLAEMQTMLVGEPFQRVSVDITGPHPTHGQLKDTSSW